MTHPETRPLPNGTLELAKATWARMSRPSARKVSRAMRQAGFPVSFPTIARWKREQWRPAERVEHPLDAARSALDCAIPVLNGKPDMTAERLVAGTENKGQFDKKADHELLIMAAREALKTQILVQHEIQARVVELVRDRPAELGFLLQALANHNEAAVKAMRLAFALKRPPTA